MPEHRILSIDGGGIAVLMSLLLLRRIEKARPGFLAAADLLAGTSAGGFSAIIIASEPDPVVGLESAIDFWLETPILSPRARHLIGGLLGVRSMYSHAELRAALIRALGNKRLGELPRKVMVAAVQLDGGQGTPGGRRWQPRALSNEPADRAKNEFLDTPAVDIALRSGAAPIVWPIYQGYVDGGLFANDPSMLVLSRVLRARLEASRRGRHARRFLEDIALFSVGEGQSPHYLPVKNAAWGWSQWLLRPHLPGALLELAMESAGEEISEQCRLLLGEDQYFRLNPNTTIPVGRTGLSHGSRMHQWERQVAAELSNPLADAQGKAVVEGDTYHLGKALNWIDRSSWLPSSSGVATGTA